MIAPVLLAAILPFVSADIQLYHRIFHPADPHTTFTPKGALQLADSVVSFHPSADIPHASDTDTLYQVALARDAHSSQHEWIISSVKACHLPHISDESFTLHTRSSHSAEPFAFDYFVSPIPHDGSCANSTHSSPRQSVNSTVYVVPSRTPPSPELKTPPPISPEGEVVKPVPEQSFLQKYWLYIAGFVLIFLLTGAPEEEPQKK